MIHPVYMPTNSDVWLYEAIDLQLTMLEIAAAMSAKFGEDGAELRRALQQRDNYREKAEDITKWVIRKDGYKSGERKSGDLTKPTSFWGRLQIFSAEPNTSAKLELCREIRSDIQLLKEPECRRFQATFVRTEWHKAAGNFLYQWYDLWDTGLNQYLFLTCTSEKYSRKDFIQDFVTKNPNLYICPICDASAYRNETSSGTYTSIDHFFPRRQYPHLALHPLNLVPMCPACNSGEATQRDPQTDIAGITEIFLPYRDKDRGLAAHTYLKVNFRSEAEDSSITSATPISTHALVFALELSETSDHNGDLLLKQINNFNRVYGVVNRWNKENNLTLIDEHVFRRIRQFLLTDVERGQPLHNPQFLLERLDLLMALIHQQGLGRDPFSYIMIWWLMYHINSIEKQKSRIAELDVTTIDCETRSMPDDIEPLFAELYYWAQEQQETFKHLKEQAAKLRSRIKTDDD